MTNKTKNKDFIEIKYTGYLEGKPFDSNIEEDLKVIDPKGKTQKVVVSIGEGMVVSGLDNALLDKEVGKDYEIELKPKEAFGERRRELVRLIPLKEFTEKKIHPRPGMAFTIDNSLVRILAVSGARVTVDFNNPLSGKNVVYKFKIIRMVDDVKEKAEAFFQNVLRYVPEMEVSGDKIIARGSKGLDGIVKSLGSRFKEVVGKEIVFEEKVEKKEEVKKEVNKSEN